MVANVEIQAKKPKIFIFSVGLFVLVFALTIWLSVFNYYSQKSINTLNEELSTVKTNLETEKQDWYYVVYNQLQNSKIILEKYRNLSAIPEFVANLETLSKDKNIEFTWFAYSDWKIKSKAKVVNTELSTASKKLSDFIGYFRDENNNHIFSLDFVNYLEGQDNISFNVEFDLNNL